MQMIPSITRYIPHFGSCSRIPHHATFLSKPSRSLLLLAMLLLSLVTVHSAREQSTGRLIANASTFSPIGHIGGPALTVAIQGSYAYVGHSFEFAIVDVSNPTLPTRIAYLTLSSNDIAIQGAYAYIATRTGLAIVDMDDPTNPILMGRLTLGEPATHIEIIGEYVYLLGTGGLTIIDVRQPASPRAIGFLALAGRLEQVTLDGDRAYVTSNRGITAIDISEPHAPVLRATRPIPGYAESAAVDSGTLYIAAGDQGLQVMPVSSISNANSGESVLLGGNAGTVYAEAVTVREQHVYVADGTKGLHILERESLSPVGFVELPGYALDVTVAGNYAYMIDRYHGMAIVDITQPDAPNQVGLYAAPGFIGNVNVGENYAYVTTMPQGDVHILDISRPANLHQIGYAETFDAAESVAVADHYLYVAGGYAGFEVLDVTTRNAPNHIARIDTLGYTKVVRVMGNYAYVATETGLQILDIHNPAAPQEIGCFCAAGAVEDAVIRTQDAILLHKDGFLERVSLADPTAPQEMAFFKMTPEAVAIDYVDDRVYVAAGEQGLHILGFSAQGNPIRVGLLEPGGYVNDVAVVGRYAYLVVMGAGVVAVDISDPAHPVEVPRHALPGQARRLVVQNDRIYVASHSGGLFVLSVPNR